MGRKDGSTLRGPQTAAGEPTGHPDGEDERWGKIIMGDRAALAPPPEKARDRSWVAIGSDTSLTALSVVATGYDVILDKLAEPAWAEIRWLPEDDYFERLGQAAKGHDLLLDVMATMPIVDLDRVYIAIEEPFPFGMLSGRASTFQSSWVKQQCEVAGAFKGALVRYGFKIFQEINNSQWHAVLRKEGVPFKTAPKGSDSKTKARIRHDNKFLVKDWAMQAWGLPELPDLVKTRTSAKIPRPASGFGAKAKAEQPSDVYDAAACLAWMVDQLEEMGITD